MSAPAYKMPLVAVVAIAMSLLLNGVLVVYAADLRRDLNSADARIEAAVQDAEERLAARTEEALAQLGELDDLRSELQQLERALFGVGAPALAGKRDRQPRTIDRQP